MLRVLHCDCPKRKSVPEAKTLEEKIRQFNHSTVIKTNMSMKTGDKCAPPAGLGLFSPYKLDSNQADAADKELVRLFKQPRTVLDSLGANARGNEFIALFWQNHGQQIISLQKMLDALFPHTPSLVAMIKTSYVPLMAAAMRISEKTVYSASAEIIQYKPGSGGLGSHIDNIVRTKGKVGPICSINLVTDRSIDMLPTFVPSAQPARLDTGRGDLLIMDSDARILWSHSVPFGDKRFRYSMIIRPVVNATKGKNRGMSPFGTVISHPTFT